MTRKEAQGRVEGYLESLEEADPELDLVLLEESTIEFPHGWVFFYQSKRFVETGDERQFLLGNAPILIDQRDGSLHETGTARRAEYYIKNYMDTGDPNVEAVHAVVISGWRDGADKVSATRLLNQETQLGLAGSKMCIDRALDRIPTSIQTSDFRQAERLRASLDALGWLVSIERQPPNKAWDATRHSDSIPTGLRSPIRTGPK